MDEREMLVKYIDARDKLNKLKEELTEAQKIFDEEESRLVTMLIDKEATSTARYEGVGFATLTKPRLFASYSKEYEQDVFQFVEKSGERELMKISIHPSFLSGFVSRLIEDGKVVPEFVRYYMKQGVRFYDK
ncbi:MAG: hypothetical protein HY761_09905 [Candidatus Omnitrophica bacterium]|nr:hypothetical protein [Candidatus Omnitrophota bacterium]